MASDSGTANMFTFRTVASAPRKSSSTKPENPFSIPERSASKIRRMVIGCAKIRSNLVLNRMIVKLFRKHETVSVPMLNSILLKNHLGTLDVEPFLDCPERHPLDSFGIKFAPDFRCLRPKL